jgi:hypothetical protein
MSWLGILRLAKLAALLIFTSAMAGAARTSACRPNFPPNGRGKIPMFRPAASHASHPICLAWF